MRADVEMQLADVADLGRIGSAIQTPAATDTEPQVVLLFLPHFDHMTKVNIYS